MIRGSETVQIERRTKVGQDQWNNAVWETVTTSIDDVLVGWGGTSTTYGTERVLITSAATLYLPAGTVVLDNDVFIVRGVRYLRDGEAQTWQTPPGFSLSVGVVLNLKRAEG